jgi:RimJ/RimL family protein N-acetyltransferase
MILETTRLRPVPLGAEFASELWSVHSDPAVARYVGGESLTAESTRDQVEWFARVWEERAYGQSAVIWRATGEMLGRIGLSFWPEWDETELGYVLCRAAQGRGIAQEGARAWISWATANLAARHLIAVIHPDNTPSARLAQRLGFVVDRRETVRGLEVDVYHLDLCR